MAQFEKNVRIMLPKNLIKNFANGKLEFLKSDDKKKDLNLSFQPDTAGQFIVEGKNFVRGLYKVRLQWESDEKSYYREQDLMLE